MSIKVSLHPRPYDWKWRRLSVDPMPKYGKRGGWFVLFGPFCLRCSDW